MKNDNIIDQAVNNMNKKYDDNWNWRIQSQDLVCFNLDQVREIIRLALLYGESKMLHSVMDTYENWRVAGPESIGGISFEQWLNRTVELLNNEF